MIWTFGEIAYPSDCTCYGLWIEYGVGLWAYFLRSTFNERFTISAYIG
jgi:hypothetical protein